MRSEALKRAQKKYHQTSEVFKAYAKAYYQLHKKEISERRKARIERLSK